MSYPKQDGPKQDGSADGAPQQPPVAMQPMPSGMHYSDFI